MQKKIYIAGHTGLVGSALLRCLNEHGYQNLVYQSSTQLDLRNQAAVQQFFNAQRPEYVFLAAAKVGGIAANAAHPAQFLYDNLMIEANVLHAAWQSEVKKLLFLGSSCIYPKLAPQPITEEALLSGPLEPTNEAYALAKITGIKLCQAYRQQYGCNFISAMPTNLYGPNDNYDLESSHVLPALIRKFHEAKIRNAPEVVIWGSGNPRREFLYVDDLADACLLLMEKYDEETPVNVGCGQDLSIRELAEHVQAVIAYKGQLVFDTSRPDGTPRKLLDISKISQLGFKPRISLTQGIAKAYDDFLKTQCLSVL